MKYFLFGCGGIGCELADYLSSKEDAEIVFIDDDESKTEAYGFPVLTLEKANERFPLKEYGVTITLGEPALRGSISGRLAAMGIPERTIDIGLYHSAKTVELGEGSIVHVGAILTVKTKIGRSCLVNKGVVVGHDCTIGDYCVLSPNVTIGGTVVVGEGTFIGSGAVLRNNITVGKNAIIGMGSVITKDVEDDSVVVGNPGKFLRKNVSRRVF